MVSDWTDADYGRENGHADALTGCEPDPYAYEDKDDAYNIAYRQSYDATLAGLYPNNIRPVT